MAYLVSLSEAIFGRGRHLASTGQKKGSPKKAEDELKEASRQRRSRVRYLSQWGLSPPKEVLEIS